jgi:UDP-N-acetylmuramate--alanine ligase
MADVVVVTDVYPAREQPIPGVTGEIVAKAARQAGADVHWIPSRADVLPCVEGMAAEGDVVVTLGAGDITDIGRAMVSGGAGVAP